MKGVRGITTMKRTLMVFAAISAFAAPALAPVAALAQDRGNDDHAQGPRREGVRSGGHNGDHQQSAPDNGGDRGGRSPSGDRPNWGGGNEGGGRGDGGGRPERPSQPAPTPQPQPQPDRPQRPDRPTGGWNGGNGGQNRPDRPDQGRPGNSGQNGNGGWNGNGGRPDQGRPGQGRPDQGRPDQGRPGNGNGGWNGGQNRPDRPGQGRPDQGRPGNGNGGWNGNDHRDRDRQRQDYRNRFDSGRWQQNWNRSHRSDWWRNDNRFRGWNGVRFGFYFAPGYGYYSVPRNYYGQTFYEGQYLPSIFWRYSVDDYRTYGLGYPPEGTRWVYVDNSIYLIDAYDGYIIDVIRNAWSW
jgi:Ni/Co efflux regulator RcnB